ncbi:MAG: transporter substrate-binding domain-containing protein [Clostridiales bacterium]|nr:transporter substrate-binding domain-containing protein [Clostridiales bacterium]
MRKLFVMLLVLALSVTAMAGGAEVLRVGMECNYAPFNWTQTGASGFAVPIKEGGFADGYDVQVARLVAEGLGMELEIVKTEWDGLPLALMSGKIDAIIAGMSPTQERMLSIDFSEPYYESDLVIVVRKDGPYAQATSLADFAGARVTGQLNTFHYSVIDQIPGVVKETALETFTAMIVALASSRIDGYVSERPGAMSAMISNPEFSFASFGEGQGFETLAADTTVAVGLQKGSPLLEKINAILAGISEEQRLTMMNEAMARQPLSE